MSTLPLCEMLRLVVSLYGVNVPLICGNATDISQIFSPAQFDLIIFYASLEHMTHGERMVALARSWALLPPGGVLAVVDTPNRLWYFDSHTALTPFYHWLPDDVALKYSRFSPREGFNRGFSELNETACLEFMRWGRGVSFHEFQLAIDDVDLQSSISCSSGFAREKRPLNRLRWRLSRDGGYERLLRRLKPDIHSGFFQPYLNVTLRKRLTADRTERRQE